MNVEKACEIVLKYWGTKYVLQVSRHKDGYVVCTSFDDTPLTLEPSLVRDDGTLESFFPPDHFDDELEDLEIPEKYKYKDEDE